MKVIILASRNFPVLDENLLNLDKKAKSNEKLTAIDLLIPILNEMEIRDIVIVTGKYTNRISKTLTSQITKIENKSWDKFGNLYSLYLGLKDVNESCIISYGDVLFDKFSLKKLLSNKNNDFTIAYDSVWQKRYISRSQKSLEKVESIRQENSILTKIYKGNKLNILPDGEFCGLFLTSSKGTKIISRILEKAMSNKISLNPKKDSIIDLISYLIENKKIIKAMDIYGKWSEMDTYKDLKSFLFKGKADTLKYLDGIINNAFILPQISFTLKDWKKNSEQIINNINKKKWPSLVIRSSAEDEDNLNTSSAGKYSSLINIPNKVKDLKKAIEIVILSIEKFSKNSFLTNTKNKVLVQPFLDSTEIHGVAFSNDIKNAAPYYVINFDINNNTEGVTSGKSKTQEIAYISRYKASFHGLPNYIVNIINLITELENITGCLVDIEFGIKKNKLYLFQVRPLLLKSNNNYFLENKIKHQLACDKKTISNLIKSKKNIFGNSNLFSDMTDWNPAEIIGVYPKKLSLSLYKYIITNKTWALARKNIGYKDLTSEKLMITLAGHPFINIRNSFNSLLPADISIKLGKKLINYYLNELANSPYLHDKVEFNILYTCYTPNTHNDLILLKNKGFSNKEILSLMRSLKKLTKNILINPKLSINKNMKKVKLLEKKFKIITDNPSYYTLASLLKICINYGTLPFAIFARYAFIATKIFKDMEKLGLISKESSNKFFGNIETIASKSAKMYKDVQEGKVTINMFLKEFGHLRPGTYDCLQYRYDQSPETYFNKTSIKKYKKKSYLHRKLEDYENCFNIQELKEIQKFCNAFSESFTYKDFFKFAVDSIKCREYAKFQFTKIISYIQERFKEFGVNLNIIPDDLVFLEVKDILNFKNKDKQSLIKKVEIEKKKYELYKLIKLPGFIKEPNDVDFFKLSYDKPNYITNKIVTGKCVNVKQKVMPLDVDNKIIIIENADPGFDWLFTHNIKGLVTKYGGVASHMAIRCAEFNLPAAIGCGELIFENLLKSETITIDCENELIKGH